MNKEILKLLINLDNIKITDEMKDKLRKWLKER